MMNSIKDGFFYDSTNDILSIHKGFKNGEKFKTNIDIGSVILDMSNKGRIIGIELMNATDFFQKKSLDITNADFNADVTPKNIIIQLSLKVNGSSTMLPATIAVPLEKPLMA